MRGALSILMRHTHVKLKHMNICYCIIQTLFTLIGSIALFFAMFFNNVNLKEVLSDGIVEYMLFKNVISILGVLLYIVIVTILSIALLGLISKIFNSEKISPLIIKKVFYYQLIYYSLLHISANICLIRSLNIADAL